MNKLYITINSGKFKGKKLVLPSMETTRSTKSIVKGSFFDTFRYEISGAIFIEVFGGSGSMAAEALSNGAKKAYAIEKDFNAFKILKENFKNLDKNLLAINADSFVKIHEIIKNIDEKIIIYIDPPFSIRDGKEQIYEMTIKMIEKFSNQNIFLIAIEHISSVEFKLKIGQFKKIKSKKFGLTTLSYYEKS
ncbi:RNA methyltransferase, RsmD family [Campylobacter blaseri]|uniref:16S rRNA (Guanine(966)-N(2))-methyltransferase RsmD n=1 Tax=Campylobacter blaseri TaxID=2042961 RepID=A0A2P8R2A1_9BACT|nr:16S rRNA (guanine(966)-N(2))-methyltransferase RsmD [Campylobacter blaseri]PSM52620.1 16S rRNA (guanine(966)-N(2))-methyltransferase RsmD [Campylobacter blaseri]PSM54268.1 16S rRNA (guanine(966)-N(2))-methyltransferase RsmD [Campylobacter blaseri]QKF85919.1 RNA methyltransferase, RsmD family [Campylobacter blaseri]